MPEQDLRSTPAWRAAYAYAYWRSGDERSDFADYHAGRVRSSERHIIRVSYDDWLFHHKDMSSDGWGDVDVLASKRVAE